MNLYAYTSNDPVNFTDPSGLSADDDDDDDDKNRQEEAEQVFDEIVVTGSRIRRSSFRFSSGREAHWIIPAGAQSPEDITRAKVKKREIIRCRNGNEVEVITLQAPRGGEVSVHSHSNAHVGIPGPGDGEAARRSTMGLSYVVTQDRVFKIKFNADRTFQTTILSGPKLASDLNSRLTANMQRWSRLRASKPPKNTKEKRKKYCKK